MNSNEKNEQKKNNIIERKISKFINIKCHNLLHLEWQKITQRIMSQKLKWKSQLIMGKNLKRPLT